MTASTHNYEALEITKLVFSADPSDGAVIALHCAGDQHV